MISAFGTPFLLQHERDDGISDHQTRKRNFMTSWNILGGLASYHSLQSWNSNVHSLQSNRLSLKPPSCEWCVHEPRAHRKHKVRLRNTSAGSPVSAAGEIPLG